MRTLVILLNLFLLQQDRFVQIEGHRFRIREFGQGDVTVVFESGMSDELEKWQDIPDSENQASIEVPLVGPQAFFRLVKP